MTLKESAVEVIQQRREHQQKYVQRLTPGVEQQREQQKYQISGRSTAAKEV